LKKKLEQLRKDPQAEIYSQERRVWETAVFELKNAIVEIEGGLIYKKAALAMAEEKLKDVKSFEEEIRARDAEKQR